MTDTATILRLAVASKEGQAISEHFGHAKTFLIYEFRESHLHFLEQRQVEHYCLGHTSSKTAMAGILEALKDCTAVFVAKIGDGPQQKLKAMNVAAVSDYAWEDIEPSLLDYVQKQAQI